MYDMEREDIEVKFEVLDDSMDLVKAEINELCKRLQTLDLERKQTANDLDLAQCKRKKLEKKLEQLQAKYPEFGE